jgi:hypothetical protein
LNCREAYLKYLFAGFERSSRKLWKTTKRAIQLHRKQPGEEIEMERGEGVGFGWRKGIG